MGLPAPYFVREQGLIDSVAEFRAFVDAVGSPAAQLLGELAGMHNFGVNLDTLCKDNAATTVSGLYCRKIESWAIFYVLSPNGKVTVVYVAGQNPHPFSELENEAERRLRRLEPKLGP